MTETRQIAGKESRKLHAAQAAQTPLRPAADVFEDSTGITLHMDMPGVTREQLDIHVEGDSLRVSGEIRLPVPEGTTSLHADVQSTHYERTFSLSRELDVADTQASLHQGVLVLRIPKRAEHKPRRIPVQTS